MYELAIYLPKGHRYRFMRDDGLLYRVDCNSIAEAIERAKSQQKVGGLYAYIYAFVYYTHKKRQVPMIFDNGKWQLQSVVSE